MDLPSQILTAVVAAVNADAYLSAGVAVAAIKEDPLDSDSDNDVEPEAYRSLIQSTMNTCGVVGVASVPDPQTETESGVTTYTGVIAWMINKKVNKSATGAQKPGHLVAIYCAQAIKNLIIDITNDAAVVCQKLKVLVTRPGEYIGEEDGVSVWAVEYIIRCRI
jgi:hypothetical protein